MLDPEGLDRLELDGVAAVLVQDIKDWQSLCCPHDHLPHILEAIGITCLPYTANLAVPEQHALMLTPENLGRSNNVVGHEACHVLLHYLGLDAWLDTYAPDGNYMNEWLCNNAACFWTMPQARVDSAVRNNGVCVQAVLELEALCKVSRSDALKRLVQDSPDIPRAGFILKSNHVVHVEVNGMRLPFWKWSILEPTAVSRLFPDELRLSFEQTGRDEWLGVVSL